MNAREVEECINAGLIQLETVQPFVGASLSSGDGDARFVNEAQPLFLD
jgi:hypothetical protein